MVFLALGCQNVRLGTDERLELFGGVKHQNFHRDIASQTSNLRRHDPLDYKMGLLEVQTAVEVVCLVLVYIIFVSSPSNHILLVK